MHPIFVFDGHLKHDHRIHTTSVSSLENLILAFGFSVWHACGEAGAECAALVTRKHAHAVMTDDVDAFLFGAPRIVRNLSAEERAVASITKDTGEIDVEGTFTEVYDLARVEEMLNLDRDGMILVALMSGNDYAPEGVRGVGIKAAIALAKLGWGKQIVDGVKDGTLDRQAIQRGIEHELSTNASGGLTKRMPSVKLDTNFPDEEIVRSYVLPVTKIGKMEQAGEPAPVFKEGLRPDVSALAVLCTKEFGWSTQKTVRGFVKKLFPAVACFDMRQARWSNIVNDPLASLETAKTPISKPTPVSVKFTSTPRRSLPKSTRTPTTGPSPQQPITDYFKSITPVKPATPIAAQPVVLILAVHDRRTQHSVRELYIEWAGCAIDTFVAEVHAFFDEGSGLVVAAGMTSSSPSSATQSDVVGSTPTVLRESRAANAIVRKQWVEEELVRKCVPELVIAFEKAETAKMQRREPGEGGKNGKGRRKKKIRVMGDGLITGRIDEMFARSKIVAEKRRGEEREEENYDVGETAVKMSLGDESDDAMGDVRIDQMDDPIAMKIKGTTEPKMKAKTASKEKQTDFAGPSSDVSESVKTDVRLQCGATPMRDDRTNEQFRSQRDGTPVRSDRNNEQTRSQRNSTPVRDDRNNAPVRSQRGTPVRDDRNNPFLANSDEHVGHGGGLFGEETNRQEMDATESWTGARKRASRARRTVGDTHGIEPAKILEGETVEAKVRAEKVEKVERARIPENKGGRMIKQDSEDEECETIDLTAERKAR